MAIRYKAGGKYAYETHNVWNKESKKYETKWHYLGIVDKDTGKPKPKRDARQEKLILAHGDSFALNEFVEKLGLKKLLQSVFGHAADELMALSFYKLLESGAMRHAGEWVEGNFAKFIFNSPGLSSQEHIQAAPQVRRRDRIAEILLRLPEETIPKAGRGNRQHGAPQRYKFPSVRDGKPRRTRRERDPAAHGGAQGLKAALIFPLYAWEYRGCFHIEKLP